MIPFDTQVSARGTSGVDVILKRMVEDDAATLANAFAEMSPWSRYPLTPQSLLEYFRTKEACAPRYGIHLNDPSTPVIGALGLRENWLRGPYIQFLGLTDAYQSRGIGEAMLCQVQDQARETGAQNLWVMASKFNDRAQAFYCRFGFYPVATIDALVTADQSEVLLRKRLG